MAIRSTARGARRFIPQTDRESIERIKLLSTENAQLRAELGSVKDRLETIERIVTDQPQRLAREIDALGASSKGGTRMMGPRPDDVVAILDRDRSCSTLLIFYFAKRWFTLQGEALELEARIAGRESRAICAAIRASSSSAWRRSSGSSPIGRMRLSREIDAVAACTSARRRRTHESMHE